MKKVVKCIKVCMLFICSIIGLNVSGEEILNPQNIKIGDIIFQKNKKLEWSVIKILEIDKWPDGSYVAHCLVYKDTKNKPNKETIKDLPILVYHAPIDANNFYKGWELIENKPVVKEELVGFVEYLKSMDFPRYIKVTNQDAREVIRNANFYYDRANALGNIGKRKEAIDEYTKAIDIFPLFYEAIDNRAFTYMELGDYQTALSDFEYSLRIEPNGATAFFSKGECFLRLGKLKEAEAVFKEGLVRFPEKKDMFNKFLNTTRAMIKNG